MVSIHSPSLFLRDPQSLVCVAVFSILGKECRYLYKVFVLYISGDQCEVHVEMIYM